MTSPALEALNAVLERLREEHAFQTHPHVKAGLSIAADIVRDEIESEQTWERINAMTPEEVRAELRAAGYTDEQLEASLAKIRATVQKALAERAAEVAEQERVRGEGL